MAVKLADVKQHPTIRAYVQQADDNLAAMGFTEHGLRHISLVSDLARSILLSLGREERLAELAAIAGYVHDLGNCVGGYITVRREPCLWNPS